MPLTKWGAIGEKQGCGGHDWLQTVDLEKLVGKDEISFHLGLASSLPSTQPLPDLAQTGQSIPLFPHPDIPRNSL